MFKFAQKISPFLVSKSSSVARNLSSNVKCLTSIKRGNYEVEAKRRPVFGQQITRNMSLDIRQLEELKDLFPLLAYQRINDELILVVSSDKIFLSLSFLKYHIGYRYQMLSCVSGVDFLGEIYRFSVVYDLLSLTYNSRMRIKVFVNEITPVASAVNVFINANWWEREIWDLYGIYFDNHPDLRRILTDYGFEGHPMRKDFPLSGYVELRYDDSKKRVVVEPLELTQEFRTFSFETPW
jgi:NADH/F420H2 dehydrogenase subunit C